MLHLLQFAEMAVAVLAALFLEINALVLLIMLVCFVLHEATALWDLSYASARREVTPIEQHVRIHPPSPASFSWFPVPQAVEPPGALPALAGARNPDGSSIRTFALSVLGNGSGD
jgi:hypothetical protein